MPDPTSAVTLIAARFAHLPRLAGAQAETPPGASFAITGTEVDWDTPDGFPRRQRKTRAWLGIWPDEAQAAAYLAARRAALPLLQDAEDCLALLALPFACHGALNWTGSGQADTLYPALSPRPASDSPILVMTSLGIGNPQDGLVEFGRGVTEVRAAFARNPAVLMDVNMIPDRPDLDGPTLTLWRSERDVIAGAYRSEPHKSVMSRRNGAMARASFTRMAATRIEGRWNGTDLTPVADRP